MSFFDQKEDVLKIELTPFGKQLLAKGQFKPEYYAFFDDDIIYDTNFAGFSEEQNNTELRILENTVFNKPQVCVIGRETSYNQLPEHFVSENIKRLNNTEIKEFSAPIGTSEIGKNFNPAWNLNFLKGEISSHQTFIDYGGTTNVLPIPQLNLKNTEYSVEIRKDNLSSTSFNNPTSDIQMEDGTILSVKEDYILLEILEKNVEETKDNFEIELFLVDGDESADGKNLIKLNFSTKPSNIVDGFLLDDDEMPKIEDFPDLNPTYVQHYFNILVDKEIDIRNIESKQTTLLDTINTVSGNYRSTSTEPFGKDC